MLNKYQFITVGDIKNIQMPYHFSDVLTHPDVIGVLNKLLLDKCQTGLTRVPLRDEVTAAFVCGAVGGKDDFDTHKAFVFLEPIKKVCDHWKDLDLGKRRFEFDFCPLCGEKLC